MMMAAIRNSDLESPRVRALCRRNEDLELGARLRVRPGCGSRWGCPDAGSCSRAWLGRPGKGRTLERASPSPQPAPVVPRPQPSRPGERFAPPRDCGLEVWARRSGGRRDLAAGTEALLVVGSRGGQSRGSGAHCSPGRRGLGAGQGRDLQASAIAGVVINL